MKWLLRSVHFYFCVVIHWLIDSTAAQLTEITSSLIIHCPCHVPLICSSAEWFSPNRLNRSLTANVGYSTSPSMSVEGSHTGRDPKGPSLGFRGKGKKSGVETIPNGVIICVRFIIGGQFISVLNLLRGNSDPALDGSICLASAQQTAAKDQNTHICGVLRVVCTVIVSYQIHDDCALLRSDTHTCAPG